MTKNKVISEISIVLVPANIFLVPGKFFYETKTLEISICQMNNLIWLIDVAICQVIDMVAFIYVDVDRLLWPVI